MKSIITKLQNNKDVTVVSHNNNQIKFLYNSHGVEMDYLMTKTQIETCECGDHKAIYIVDCDNGMLQTPLCQDCLDYALNHMEDCF